LKIYKLITRTSWALLLTTIYLVFSAATCKYGFKDSAPIPPEVKTFKVNFIENKASYVNPNFSPTITEKLRQKIIGNTRLKQTADDDAHYVISGYVTQYNVSFTGVSGDQPSQNRLTVGVHIIFKNTLDDKQSTESDVQYSLDFSADAALQQIENSEGNRIANNVVDAIFNKIFSNW
jgi:hypothetical protein